MGPRSGKLARGLGALLIGAWLALAPSALAAIPDAGPPYPEPVTGQRVYDYAGIFTPETIASAEKTIAGIEARTGAQVAVYTQVKPESDTLDLANADALDLMNQWGVGRKGFDDGLVILFDMQPSLYHGQVSLYAGSGYKAAFLSDEDRQAIFDNDMLPFLVEGDLDGGLLAGLAKVDANATPEHAAALQRGRQINALAVLGALLVGILLLLWAVLEWLRHGRDPIYLDDPSIYLPAPPADLTPAMATLILDDRTTQRTTTAALMDLAARGTIAFTHPARLVTEGDAKVGIRYVREDGGLRGPEKRLLEDIERHVDDDDRNLSHGRLYKLLAGFDDLADDLEKAAVAHGWLREAPKAAMGRWTDRGVLEITAGVLLGAAVLFFLPISSLFMLAICLLSAGIVTLVISRSMPARTREGAMLYAMLAAYKRTLAQTMLNSSSIDAVAQSHAVPWIETPDQVMAWAVAFGLNRELEIILARSATPPEVAAAGYAAGWQPAWWVTTGHVAGNHSSAGGASVAGLFSASAIPDPGSILASVGSIASVSPPSTSGGSSGSSSFSSGGSFGGGGGGGGGGAGGGF
jgi:uncharacterized membrane protein YgcG